MKKQNNLLHGLTIAFTFLIIVLLTAGCNQGSAQQQNSASSSKKTKTQPPKVDINAAVVAGDINAVKQHIAAGSNINQPDPMGGSSPLITACLFGKTDIAKLLIDAGANINFINNDGSTPLHTAAFFCRPAIVQMLLQKNADKTIKNKYGQTACQIVSGPFPAVKGVYDGIGKMLAPMGLVLDYPYLEKTRPEIATMLK